MKDLPLFLRISDLAEAANISTVTIERMLYKYVITPDAEIQHGRSRQPIFSKSRLKEHLTAIKAHRESVATANV
jgi:hypothetical protein